MNFVFYRAAFEVNDADGVRSGARADTRGARSRVRFYLCFYLRHHGDWTDDVFCSTLNSYRYVHRDVKPDNLLLGLGEGGGRTIHLVDFGLAAPGPSRVEGLTLHEGWAPGTRHSNEVVTVGSSSDGDGTPRCVRTREQSPSITQLPNHHPIKIQLLTDRPIHRRTQVLVNRRRRRPTSDVRGRLGERGVDGTSSLSLFPHGQFE